MGKRNMKAIMVLNNYWQWSGGMSQYINWVTGKPIIDPDVSGDWNGFQAFSATFYTNKEANELFHDYIRMLLDRTNTYSNIKYKNDPAIMTWELANEPRPAPDAVTDSADRQAFYKWIDETASFIKQLDQNHLITTGSEGTKGSRESMEIYEKSSMSPSVDYVTFHIWPKNWSWYNAKNPSKTFDTTMLLTLQYFNEHLEMARKLGKPTVLEEFGLERDNGAISPDSSTTYRDKFLTTIVKTLVDSIHNGAPIAGFNYWTWGGEGRAAHPDGWWRPGDSFMGDPPQEQQGLNSIFNSDSTTLGIFDKYKNELVQP
jgi:mannan endo-1,4-beta-mannosidase